MTVEQSNFEQFTPILFYYAHYHDNGVKLKKFTLYPTINLGLILLFISTLYFQR
jgi:hypothetical protein